MKTKRREMLKNVLAGAAGIAGLGFAGNAMAQTNDTAQRTFAKKSKYPVEPVTCTRLGNQIFVSGIGCYEGPHTIENHTKVVMTKLHRILEEAGSSINKVHRCTAWIDDIKNFAPMNAVYNPMGPNGRRGTRSCMAVPKGHLPGNSLLVVDAIAYI